MSKHLSIKAVNRYLNLSLDLERMLPFSVLGPPLIRDQVPQTLATFCSPLPHQTAPTSFLLGEY